MARNAGRHTSLVCSALALVLAAVGCSDNGADPGTTSTLPPATTGAPPPTTSTAPSPTTEARTTTTLSIPAEPVRGGTVTVGVDADLVFGFGGAEDDRFLPPSMNPLRDGTTARDIARLVVPGAFRLDGATGELVPWLVTEIPRISNGGVVVAEDGTATVTYRVRDDATWADGTAITAADLVFTHGLIVDSDPAFPVASELLRVHEVVAPDSVTADGKVLSLRLTEPNPAYERLFEWVVPAHAVDPATFGDDWNDRMWLSGGPFQFVSYDPPTDPEQEPGRIRLERNPAYWETDSATGASLPYLDAIDVLAFTPGAMAGTTIATWFSTRSTDALLGFLVPEFRRTYLGDPDEAGFAFADGWGTLIEVMAFELRDDRFTVNPGSLNEYLDYRRTVLATINRADVGETSRTLPVSSLLGTAIDALDHDAWAQYDEPGLAVDLAEDLGAALGRDLTAEPPHAVYVSSSGDETIAVGNAVVDQLNAAGFDAEAQFDGDFFGTQWPNGLTDLYAFRMFAGTGGLSSLAENMRLFDALNEDTFGVNWASLGAPAVRYHELMEQAAAALDRDRLAELLTEAETLLADNAVVYPLARRQHTYQPYWPDRIQGIVPNRYQGWDTWNAAWWWSPRRR